MNLSTVIITHDEEKHIKKCLDSIGTHEVILVDNASTDQTVSIVQSNFPQAKIIRNKTNLGVAQARNQGIKEATGEYIMFLDADAELANDTINKLLEAMEQKPRAGIVAPKLIYPNGKLQYSCRRFPTFWNILSRGFLGESDSPNWYLMRDYDHKTPREVDWVMGACQLIRREVLNSIGLLDGGYFYGYEDVDFCWRALRKGWKVVYVPDAVAIHHYQRRSARGGIFNRLKWSHFSSAMRFLLKKNFS